MDKSVFKEVKKSSKLSRMGLNGNCVKKILTILPFLILLLPMWQSCTEKDKEQVPRKDEKTNETERKVPSTEFLSIFDGKNSSSGYEIIWNTIDFMAGDEFEKESLKDLGFWTYFSFSLYAISSFLLLIFSFIKNRKNSFFVLSIINLCIIIAAYFLFLNFSDEITQIKYGFYLLIINSLLILCSNFWKVKELKKMPSA